MNKINIKGLDYEYHIIHKSPLKVEVWFDTHGSTVFNRVNEDWSQEIGGHDLPDDITIADVGKAIEDNECTVY